jgi:hypothetical protein
MRADLVCGCATVSLMLVACASVTLKARMGGRKTRSVRRCLLRPLHRPARRRRQDAANVPCEGNVQCQDGSLTLYTGAKSLDVDGESNWLPASGPFSLHIRAYGSAGQGQQGTEEGIEEEGFQEAKHIEETKHREEAQVEAVA